MHVMTMTLRAFSVCALFAALGCSSLPRAPQSGNPSAEAEQILDDVGASFSGAVLAASASGWAAEPVEALVRKYSEDAILFPPKGDPIEGRDAIRKYWSRTPDRRTLSHSIAVDAAELSGNLLVEYGRVTLITQIDGKPPETITLRYISAWRRDSDAVWRKRLDSWW